MDYTVCALLLILSIAQIKAVHSNAIVKMAIHVQFHILFLFPSLPSTLMFFDHNTQSLSGIVMERSERSLGHGTREVRV